MQLIIKDVKNTHLILIVLHLCTLLILNRN